MPLPDGATPLDAAPAGLERPQEEPVATTLVVRTRFWSVPLPYATAKAWFDGRPPPGLTWSTRGKGTHGPQETTAWWTASAGADKAWARALAEVSVVGGGPSTTLVRVDALVLWLDPAPVAVSPALPALRVTIAGGCPASDGGSFAVSSTGADLATRLLPAARPTSGLVCRYLGLNGAHGKPRFALVASREVDAATAARFADAVAAVPLAHTDGVTSCPMDDGATAVVVLAYPGRPDVDLGLRTNGCTSVSNGVIAAGADTRGLLTILGLRD